MIKHETRPQKPSERITRNAKSTRVGLFVFQQKMGSRTKISTEFNAAKISRPNPQSKVGKCGSTEDTEHSSSSMVSRIRVSLVMNLGTDTMLLWDLWDLWDPVASEGWVTMVPLHGSFPQLGNATSMKLQFVNRWGLTAASRATTSQGMNPASSAALRGQPSSATCTRRFTRTGISHVCNRIFGSTARAAESQLSTLRTKSAVTALCAQVLGSSGTQPNKWHLPLQISLQSP